MKGFLETYGVAIFTLVLMAILIAMAGPFGIRIKEYMLEKANYTNQIGSEEICKATNKEDKADADVAAMNGLYACLYTNGELTISATPIDNTGRTDVDTDYGKFELKKNVGLYEYVPWGEDSDKVTTVNILNKIKPTTCSHWFWCCQNLTEIKNIDNLNTSACTEMKDMFYACSSLTSLDVSNWNTSACTDMSGMFYGCSSLTSLDASHWDTSACTDMSYMFADCDNFQTLSGHHLSGTCEDKIQYCREHILDMTNVVNCEEMFGAAS